MCCAVRSAQARRSVADLDLAETPELADLTGGDGVPPDADAAVEDTDPGHLASSPCRRGRMRSRSRTRTVPANIRTYAIFSPAGPRSILNMLPADGARQRRPSAAGSRSTMPAISASTPAPVIAEPKKTGCTSARLVCAASCLAQPSGRDRALVLDVRGQQRVVLVGEHLGQPRPNAASPASHSA